MNCKRWTSARSVTPPWILDTGASRAQPFQQHPGRDATTAGLFTMKSILRIVASCVALIVPALSFGSITSQTDKTGPTLITGLPQTIPVGFPFQASPNLLVLDMGPSGALYDPAKVLTLGSDYTVTGGGYNGQNQMQVGSIAVVSTGAHAVLTNDQIVIMRNIPINQITSFAATGPLTINLLEQALDKTATIVQQVNEAGGRALQFEKFEFISPTLPLYNRKNAFLAFDSNGVPWFPTSASIVATVSSPVSAINIAALKLIPVASFSTGVTVQVNGYYVSNDGGGGVYIWNASSTTSDNGGTVIQSTGVATGRWIFQGIPNVRTFGAKGDGTSSDTSAIQSFVTSGISSGQRSFYFPAGIYYCPDIGGIATTTVNLNDINGAEFFGDYGNSTIKLGDSVNRLSLLFACGNGHPFSNCSWHDLIIDLNGANNLQPSFGSPLRNNSFIYGFAAGISNINIQRVIVLNASGSQVIRLSNDTSNVSNNVVIRDCVFSGFGQGVSGNQQQDVSVIYVYGNSITVDNCVFTNPAFTMSAAQGQTAVEFHDGYGFRCTHNNFVNVQLPVLTSSDTADAIDVEITDNEMKECLYAATIDPSGTHDVHKWKFSRNQFTSSQNYQIGLLYVGGTAETTKTRDGIVIDNNQFYISGVTGSGRAGVLMINSQWNDISIIRNVFSGLTAQAIHIEGQIKGTNVAQLIIRDNILNSCGGLNGGAGTSPLFPTDGTPVQMVILPANIVGTFNLISIGGNVFANSLAKNYTNLGHIYLGSFVSSNIIDVHDSARPQDSYTLIDDLSTATGYKVIVNGGLLLTNTPSFGATQVTSLGIGTSASATAGVVTATSKFIFSGAGSVPSPTDLGVGTNGAGTRIQVNAPTGGEHDFSINGVVVGGYNATLSFDAPSVFHQFGQAFGASATASTGSIAVKDSTGATYYLRASTTP